MGSDGLELGGAASEEEEVGTGLCATTNRGPQDCADGASARKARDGRRDGGGQPGEISCRERAQQTSRRTLAKRRAVALPIPVPEHEGVDQVSVSKLREKRSEVNRTREEGLTSGCARDEDGLALEASRVEEGHGACRMECACDCACDEPLEHKLA